MSMNRRKFVSSAAPAVVSFGALAPRFLAHAAQRNVAEKTDERVLVVIQMSGGNDGLNTIVPHKHDVYRKSRPTLTVDSRDVLSIDDELGFHPALSGFAELLEASQLAVIQGVGYPNPNRSHFESMDIWHTARWSTELRTEGWLGQCLNQFENQQAQIPALHLGHEKQPLALASRNQSVPSVASLDQFQLRLKERGDVAQLEQMVRAPRQGSGSLLDFVQSNSATALQVSEQLKRISSGRKTNISFPETGLGRKMETISKLIQADLETRLYYVTLEGFDTHSQQEGAHAALLREVGDATRAFMREMDSIEKQNDVLVMSFSEFGRRVAENASAGTDHGTAAPLFLAGGRVNGGLIGAHPSLDDLEAGDVKFHTDFRQVYATLLQQWMSVKSTDILDGDFQPVNVLKRV